MKPLDHRHLRAIADADDAPAPFATDLSTSPSHDSSLAPSPVAEALRPLADSLPHMVWIHFPGEVKHEFYNARWTEFTGQVLDPDGSTRRALIHPDDRARAVARWNRSLATGEPYKEVYRLRHHSGEYRWIMSRGLREAGVTGRPARWYGTCTDIHEHKLASAALDASESLNRSIIQASADGIAMIDADGILLFLNRAALNGIDCEDEQACLGRPWIETLPEETRPLARVAIGNALAGRPARFTTMHHVEGDQHRWRDFAITPIPGEEGIAQRLVVSARDVTDERVAQERLHWTATHDPMTRLPNRAYFHDCLQEAMRQAGRDGRKVGLMIIDVDHLQQLNDALGHDAGDRMLEVFAQRVAEALEGRHVIGRLGGDEFGVLLAGIDGDSDVAAVAQGILERLREPFVHEGRLIECRGSIGAAIFPDQGEEKAELLKAADLALRVAKAAGRGQWVIYDPAMRAELQNRASTLALVKDALRDGRVFPWYQPKVDLASGEISGFEALLRWSDPRGQIHLPGTIAVAFEDDDVARALSERMLGGALADIRGWLDAGVPFGHVALNVSAVDLRHCDFAEQLLARMRSADVPAWAIQIEVTEMVFLGRGAEYVETALRQLSEAGLKIALDDFGTGYASLSHLRKFPVDIIKIDRSFVRDLESDADDAAIIRSVIRMSKSLDIAVVAEGIETEAQREFLAEEGCEFGQGFLFAKAVKATQVPGLVAKGVRGARRAVG